MSEKIRKGDVPEKLPWVGVSISRIEDSRLLRGHGQFVDDFEPRGTLHMAVGRCPYPHARIRSINTHDALALDGVMSILTGPEVNDRTEPINVLRPLPGIPALPFHAMATDTALFEGHPVTSVVAESRARAEDALEAITIDYEPLPHVTDAEIALTPDAPVLWPSLGTNVVVENVRRRGEPEKALENADLVVQDHFRINRVTGLPMEGRAVLACYRPGTGRLEVIAGTQVPHLHRVQLSQVLRIPESRVQITAHDVGGGFGLKLGVYPEDVLACLHAIDLGCPVKWIEDRLEHFRATTHARESTHRTAIGINGSGMITGIRDDYLIDMGAYNSPFGAPMLSTLMLAGPYRITDFHSGRRVIATNKTAVGAYRGYGQPESNFIREVLVDRAAHARGEDPVTFRRRNMLKSEDMPWESPSGAVYDSGNYQRALDAALTRVGYSDIRLEQKIQSEREHSIGVGVACFVEMTGYPGSQFLGKHNAGYGAHESVTIRANRSGGIELYTGVSSFGQGTETSFAQLCASVLGVRPEDITLHSGDTNQSPQNTGAFASRTTIAGTGAILGAAGEIRAKAFRVAAHLLDTDSKTLELDKSIFRVLGNESHYVSFAEVATQAITGHRLPTGDSPGLEATHYFDPPSSAFGYGTAAALVEVDRETGCFNVQRFVLAHDCGRAINPLLVDGQLQGGLAQGFGAAFFEELQYDPESGQLMNGTMIDYLMPTSADLPEFEIEHVNQPSPVTPLGVRGVGEAGTIPPAAAVANAICDALMPLRVELRRLPITGETVLEAIDKAMDKSPWPDKGV